MTKSANNIELFWILQMNAENCKEDFQRLSNLARKRDKSQCQGSDVHGDTKPSLTSKVMGSETRSSDSP